MVDISRTSYLVGLFRTNIHITGGGPSCVNGHVLTEFVNQLVTGGHHPIDPLEKTASNWLLRLVMFFVAIVSIIL